MPLLITYQVDFFILPDVSKGSLFILTLEALEEEHLGHAHQAH